MTYREHGRRGTAQRAEQIGQENRQEDHEKPGNSSSLGPAEVELHSLWLCCDGMSLAYMIETLTLDFSLKVCDLWIYEIGTNRAEEVSETFFFETFLLFFFFFCSFREILSSYIENKIEWIVSFGGSCRVSSLRAFTLS